MKQGCLFSQFVFSIVLEILGREKDKKRQKDWKEVNFYSQMIELYT